VHAASCKGIIMDEKLFDELVGSIRQAGAIRSGEAPAARTTTFDEVDVKAIRERFGVSQPQFAGMLGISVGTLRGWEQGRRWPDGPARVLLRVAEARPDAVLAVTRPDLQVDSGPPAAKPAVSADGEAPRGDGSTVYPRPPRRGRKS
jgi:putative transcriptional regulator